MFCRKLLRQVLVDGDVSSFDAVCVRKLKMVGRTGAEWEVVTPPLLTPPSKHVTSSIELSTPTQNYTRV